MFKLLLALLVVIPMAIAGLGAFKVPTITTQHQLIGNSPAAEQVWSNGIRTCNETQSNLLVCLQLLEEGK